MKRPSNSQSVQEKVDKLFSMYGQYIPDDKKADFKDQLGRKLRGIERISIRVVRKTINRLEVKLEAEEYCAKGLNQALEELEEKLSKLRDTDWIDWNKEKPEPGKAVIVHVNTGFITVGYRKKASEGYDDTIQLFGDTDGFADEGDIITHWQPLPVTPIQEELNGTV